MATSSLIVTAGATNANAYVSLVDANQYHFNRPAADTTWESASPLDKEKAILWATKLLDSMYEWTGFVVTEEQALLWPRYGMFYRNGYYVPSDIIPQELQDATAEFARQLLVSDRAADSEVDSQGIRSLTAGPVSIAFKDFVPPKVVPDVAFHLIPREWGRVRGRVGTVIELERA